VLLIGSWVVIH